MAIVCWIVLFNVASISGRCNSISFKIESFIITSNKIYDIKPAKCIFLNQIFINYAGKSYPIIIGTGHQQVYAAMRYMQTLASICKRDSELHTLLEYINTIIQSTKNSNIPNLDNVIAFELPTEDFWDAVKMLFKNPYFKKETVAVSKIMGYQFGPIEMRHFYFE